MPSLSYPHVEFAADGTPVVSGTRTKVIEIALDRIAHHWDAEEIRRQHPHLSLGQIHGALAYYYYDHQEQLDEEMRRRSARVDEIKKTAQPSAVRDKLTDAEDL